MAAKPFSKAIEHGIFAALVRVINPDNQASNLIAGERIAYLGAGISCFLFVLVFVQQ